MNVVLAMAGPTVVAVASDTGEWLGLPPSGPFGAAALDGDTIAIARWEPRVLRLVDGAWRETEMQAPVLALAGTPRGLVAGDERGHVSLVEGARAIAADGPVVDLRWGGGVLAALLADGTLAVTRWPDDADATFGAIDTTTLGRAHALFDGPRGTIAVAGRNGLGLIDGGRLARVSRELGEPVRHAVPGGDFLFAVGDDGGAWILDDGLDVEGRVRFPDGDPVAGAIAVDKKILAWTAGGALYDVGRDATARRRAAADVARTLADELGKGRPQWN